MPFKPTPKQREAAAILSKGTVSHLLMVGGARSGKTAGALDFIVCRAARYPGSRHLAARLRFNHAKVSLWLDSIPKALAGRGLVEGVHYERNNSDYYIKFVNGSELWVDGLDSEERVEKILGREYGTTYLNEISQVSYDASTVARTRLSQALPGMRPFALYDCNPPSIRHWSYAQWFQGLYPGTSERITNPEAYAFVKMNPYDNAQNLPKGYIENELEHLPEAKRRRFLLGEYSADTEGLIFPNWDEIEAVPEEVKKHGKHSFGLDFGFSVDPAALVELWLVGDDLYIDELVYQTGLTNQALGQAMRELKVPSTPPTRADSAEPKSIAELCAQGLNVWPAEKGPDSLRAGIDWLQGRRLHVTRRSANIKNELYEYRWESNKDGRLLPVPVDDWNHAIDAIRYGATPWIFNRGSGRVRVGAA